MRVVVDSQSAVTQRAGVGRYTKCLVEHLGPLAPPDELSAFYFDFRQRGMPFAIPNASHKAIRWLPGRVVQAAWKTIGAPAFDQMAGPADVYHFPNFIRPPLRRGRSVVTIHDLAFLRHPETAESGNLAHLRAKMPQTVQMADAIIAVSEFTAREIGEHFRVPAEKIVAIHSAPYRQLAAADAAAIAACRRQFGLDRPYVLTVGTLEPRKNLAFLVEVFEQLESFDGDLVIAGARGWKFEPILERMRNSPRATRVRYLEYVPDELLPALYSGAELFVLASLYEGFGFPPLEAMACGTPVVSAATGSLPEVLGDAAELMTGFDPAHWVETTAAILAEPSRRKQLVEKGLKQVQKYSWDDTARKTWALYRRLAHSP